MYTLVTALGLAATYCLWRLFEGPRRGLWGLAFGLVSAAGLASQYFYALVLATQGLLAFFLWPRPQRVAAPRAASRPAPRRSRIWRGLVPGVVVLLMSLGLLGNDILRLTRAHAAGRVFVPMHAILIDALNVFSLGLSVRFEDVWPLELLYLAVFALGIWHVWHRPPTTGHGEQPVWADRGAALTLLLGYFLAPIVAFWLYSHHAPIYMGSRYIIMFSPAFYLGMGLGLDTLWSRRRWAAVALMVVLVAGMGYSIQRYFTHERYAAKEDHRSAAQHVMANERPGDAILLTASENIFAFEHYYRGQLDVIPLPQPPLAIPDPDALARELWAITRGYDRVWLVHCRTQFSDPEDWITGWLDGHLLPLERAYFPSYGSAATVKAYLTHSPEAPGRAATGLARFGEGIDLLRYAVDYYSAEGPIITLPHETLLAGAEDEAPAVPAGALLRVQFEWQALAPLPPTKISLRLVDEEGVMWQQRDRRPLYYWPTEEWPVGAAMTVDGDLPVPVGTPPGRYHIDMVLYREDDGSALSALRPDGTEADVLTLGSVAVGPARRALWPVPAEMRAALPEGARHERPAPRFGALALMGHRLGVDEITPGATLELALFWRAERPVHDELDLAVNWVDATGVVRHTSAHPLAGREGVPVALDAGEPLLGLHPLAVPADLPPGEYTLRLLAYRHADGSFLRLGRGPLPWPGRSLRLGTVTVHPE